MKKAPKSIKGFTLVEMMAVIVIVGILAGLAIPIYNSYTNQAKAAEAKNLLGILTSSAQLWGVQYHGYNQNGGWQGSDVSDAVFESKYFSESMTTSGWSQTGYIVQISANRAGAPFNTVTLTHVDGSKDIVSVNPPNLPGIGTGW